MILLHQSVSSVRVGDNDHAHSRVRDGFVATRVVPVVPGLRGRMAKWYTTVMILGGRGWTVQGVGRDWRMRDAEEDGPGAMYYGVEL